MADGRYETVSTFVLPDEYQRQAAEARRRRRMAELMAQQAYQPGDIQNAPIPAAAPLVQGLQAFLTARAARKAEEAEESAGEAQTREARQFLKAFTDEDVVTDAKQPNMPLGAPTVTAPEFEGGRIKTPTQIDFAAPPPMEAPQVQLSRYGNLTQGQRRALALEGVLTSQNPLVQKIGQMQYAAMQPQRPEIGAVNPADFTPESLAEAQRTGNFGALKPRAPEAKPERPIAVLKDGKPIYVSESEALGMTPATAQNIRGSTGGGGGGGGRGQQGPAFVLSNGKVVQSTFDPSTGQYMYQSDTGRVPVPADAKPTTASAASGLSESKYIAYREEAFDHRQGLKRLNSYFERIGDTNVGIQRWADAVAAKAKNLFGNPLSREQLALELAKGEQQGLLGLFRVDIVGPGVLTEYDAKRVIDALGGDLNALQNKEKVFALLQQLYQDKMDRFDFLNEELARSDLVRGGKPITAEGLPSTLGGQPPAFTTRRKVKRRTASGIEYEVEE